MAEGLVVGGEDENWEEKQEIGKHFDRKLIVFSTFLKWKKILRIQIFKFFYFSF